MPILGVVSRFQWVCLMTWSPFLGAHWVYVFFGEVSVRFFSHFKIWLYLIGIIFVLVLRVLSKSWIRLSAGI